MAHQFYVPETKILGVDILPNYELRIPSMVKSAYVAEQFITMTALKLQVTYQSETHKDAEGRLHRLDGPCSIWPNGGYEWRRHGELHREDGPAKFHPNSLWGPFEEYWLNGKLRKIKYQNTEENFPE